MQLNGFFVANGVSEFEHEVWSTESHETLKIKKITTGEVT